MLIWMYKERENRAQNAIDYKKRRKKKENEKMIAKLFDKWELQFISNAC